MKLLPTSGRNKLCKRQQMTHGLKIDFSTFVNTEREEKEKERKQIFVQQKKNLAESGII